MKILLVLALLRNLLIGVFDISDAFLQVQQRDFVIAQVPSWVREMVGDLHYWVLRKCLPPHRNAALRWNEHFAAMAL